MRSVPPTLEQLKYFRKVVNNGESTSVVELKKRIAWSYNNAEKLSVLFGIIDESAVQEVVRLKLELDQVLCNYLVDFRS